MITTMQMKFLFRKPQFPILGSIDGHFISAKTSTSLSKKISTIQLAPGESYDLVDNRGEGWSLHVNEMTISPLTFKKRWTKKEIIKMFNERKNPKCGNHELYPEKSLSAKRLDKIICDIAELAERKST